MRKRSKTSFPLGARDKTGRSPEQLEDGRLAESIWRWQYYAFRARDVVHASTILRAGTSTPPGCANRRPTPRLLVKPNRQDLTTQVQVFIEDGAGFSVLPTWTSDDPAPVWKAGVNTLVAAIGVALWNTLPGSPGVAICTNCLQIFTIHQWNQRYCSACTPERKRVEKAALRARQAARTALDPEYLI